MLVFTNQNLFYVFELHNIHQLNRSCVSLSKKKLVVFIVQVQENIFLESNDLIKSIHVILDALNRLR